MRRSSSNQQKQLLCSLNIAILLRLAATISQVMVQQMALLQSKELYYLIMVEMKRLASLYSAAEKEDVN